MVSENAIVIIGNGIAGISAARHIRKACNKAILVISDESEYFFSRTALMYIYMGHMKFEHTKPYEDGFWKKNSIQLLKARVDKILPENNALQLNTGQTLTYETLIIATGSVPKSLPIPGSDLLGVQSLYALHDLDLMERNTQNCKSALVLGGGLIGVEMAEMLHSRQIETTIVIRESHFWGNVLPAYEGNLIGRHLKKHGIKLITESGIQSFDSKDESRVSEAKLSTGERIRIDFAGITVGVEPNISWMRPSPIECDKGILVDEYLKTNIPNIYAIGDCAQLRRPPEGRQAIEPVWYTGRIMGETVAKTIAGKPQKYQPGLWFNSAKFFDIEYQVYGDVPPEKVDGINWFFWEDQASERAIRLVFDEADYRLLGLHTFGIRLRHAICEDWIVKGAKLSEIIPDFEKACFDPEFQKPFYPDFLASLKKEFPHWDLKPKRKFSLWNF